MDCWSLFVDDTAAVGVDEEVSGPQPVLGLQVSAIALRAHHGVVVAAPSSARQNVAHIVPTYRALAQMRHDGLLHAHSLFR